jgi:hypothetical protein
MGRRTNYDEFGWYVCATIFGIILFFSLLAIPISIRHTEKDIIEYRSFEQTLKEQRLNSISVLERISLTEKIIAQNQWLVREQFKAKRLWKNWYYPKEIFDLKPIQ